MYEKCEVEDMLRIYLKSNSQLKELENKISKNNVLLKYNGEKYEDTEDDLIEGMALKGVSITDMPKRKN